MTENDKNHRTRIAAVRRSNMRMQLVTAAITLMAKKAPETISIDDVILEAKVARGTFYNYFISPLELIHLAANELAEELILAVNDILEIYNDPAFRIGVGIRSILAFARQSPAFAAIIMRSAWPIASEQHAFHRIVKKDLLKGVEMGRFRPISTDVAMALLGGLTVGAMPAYANNTASPDYAEQIAETLLLGLGLSAKDAQDIAKLPLSLPQIKTEGLLAKLIL